MKEKLRLFALELQSSFLFEIKLAKNDLKKKYSGSILGFIWAFIPPMITVLVYWFIFNIGFKISPNKGIPYIIWLMSGLVPWFFFSDAIIGVTNCFWEYSYLVKKVVFDVRIIPRVKILSSLFIHLFFLFLLLILNFIFGILPSIYYLQVIYYLICLIEIIDSIGLILACINVFFKDIGQLVNLILQFSIWLVPIMWDDGLYSDTIVFFLKINPLFYVIQGYKESLIYKISMFVHVKYSIYFWFIICLLKLFSKYIFNKTKGHFADLLV